MCRSFPPRAGPSVPPPPGEIRARAPGGAFPLCALVCDASRSHDGDEHMDEHQMMCDLIVNPYRRSPRIPGSLACSVSLHLGNL